MTTLAVLADRVGWEERLLLAEGRRRGVETRWLDDGELCAGPDGTRFADVCLLRSRSLSRAAALSGVLAGHGVRLVNAPHAIRVCQSKLETARVLRTAGLPVLDFRVVLSRRDLTRAIGEFGVPCVVKPVFGGLGRRVLLVRDPELAQAAYDYVDHFGQGFDRVLLAQPFHPGADERAVVVGGRVVAHYRREPAPDDWRANVSAGGTADATVRCGQIDAVARRVAHAVGAEVFGLDLFVLPDGSCVVNEVNHVPMFRGAVRATGADVAGAIVAHALGVAAGNGVLAKGMAN
ncbi:ATP-grasp domain-containing protein [Amycolatopsis anabasis]|uniref:ATP-grasp domain-containing protein n=1 Tax=Amycolatopsis anabasis TaxID=1840409 RepID=UPI00131A8035|nr:RimK family alpha-L-glutamate ligase [Amycolatopsis anabasis]